MDKKGKHYKGKWKGLFIPLHEVDVLSNSLCVEDTRWFITDFELDTAYSACLATSVEDSPVQLALLSFYET